MQNQFEQHQQALVRALETRQQERVKSLQKFLEDRSHKEQDDIRKILEELKASILKELHRPETQQLVLTGFTTPEREQFERNRSFLETRAAEIDNEIQQEVKAIQQRFADPTARYFPVAVTFLVPEKLAY